MSIVAQVDFVETIKYYSRLKNYKRFILKEELLDRQTIDCFLKKKVGAVIIRYSSLFKIIFVKIVSKTLKNNQLTKNHIFPHFLKTNIYIYF